MSNQVKFRVYSTIQKMMAKQDLDKLTQLAWKAAQQQQIHPTRILIRSNAHNTTMGKKDPNGWHYTICLKDRATEAINQHIAYHAYVPNKTSYQLVKGIFTKAKADSTPRGSKGKVVWDDTKMVPIHDVVYGEPLPPSPAARAPEP
ncbi:hypothetical protein diail_9962 [Diaporthe ilicicola]|nr:hypothetical protein diail_9962 [Diaporthe ilicicola]